MEVRGLCLLGEYQRENCWKQLIAVWIRRREGVNIGRRAYQRKRCATLNPICLWLREVAASGNVLAARNPNFRPLPQNLIHRSRPIKLPALLKTNTSRVAADTSDYFPRRAFCTINILLLIKVWDSETMKLIANARPFDKNSRHSVSTNVDILLELGEKERTVFDKG